MLKNRNIYGLSYKHKEITIYKISKRICLKKDVEINTWLDDVVTKNETGYKNNKKNN